jgi:hypothetical protein
LQAGNPLTFDVQRSIEALGTAASSLLLAHAVIDPAYPRWPHFEKIKQGTHFQVMAKKRLGADCRRATVYSL